MRGDKKTPVTPRGAVLYVGPPTTGDGRDGAGERAAAEARRQAAALGLAPREPVARTEEEADALLARDPDAVLVVHPGERPGTRWPEPGTTLWNLLRVGAVLRLCDPEAVGDPQSPPAAPPLSGPVALLVVDLIAPATRFGPHYLRRRRREIECRAFAARLGLRDVGVFGSDRFASFNGHRLTSLSPLGPAGTVTAVVHPDVTAPDPGTPDGLLWRWLRQGRVIHPGRRPGSPEEPAATRSSGPGASANRLSRSTTPPGPAVYDSADRVAAIGDDACAAFGRAGGEDDPDVLDFLSHAQEYHGRAFQTDSALSVGRFSSSPPPRSPFHTPRDTGRPLPHDGLFIRRNNAFGTRSVLGVKDLIEQGVIIGQDQIRFDDFVAARTDQVPGPRAGEAVAVSHGLAAVPGEFKASEATTHFVEITLKAGEARPEDAPTTESLPVNFVFAVDTSVSMTGEKLDTVKAALQTIYRALRPADCLGIITFDHSVRTVLPAVAKRDLTPERFTNVVSALTAGGGTDINLGVQYGIDEISRHSVSGRTVNCLYLFSDGDPTSGERDWIRIRTNIAAKLRGDLTLSCFGFGSDARMPELAALAGLAGGHSTFVTRPEQIGADLLGDLSRRDHLAAIDIQLKLDIDPGVEIRHLYGHDLVTDRRARAAVLREAGQAAARARDDYGTKALPDIIDDEKGVRIFAPDLAFEETYWVVLEVRVPPGRELTGLGTAVVQYVDTVARESRRHEIDLSQALTLSEETVTVHAVGLWTSEVTFYALDDLYDHDKVAAKDRLTRHLKALEDAHSHLPAKEFRDDQVTLRKFMTLAGTLGSAVFMSDVSHSPGFAPTFQVMNEFGRVRSGFWPHH